MESKNDVIYAFPLDHIPDNCPAVPKGMLLRDYFAAKAMHGIVSHSDTWGFTSASGIAEEAYGIADAMLKARGSV